LGFNYDFQTQTKRGTLFVPQPYTRIEIKIPDDLMTQINQARLETPVATWIKDAIKQRLNREI